jgi:hypothetical protein
MPKMPIEVFAMRGSARVMLFTRQQRQQGRAHPDRNAGNWHSNLQFCFFLIC